MARLSFTGLDAVVNELGRMEQGADGKITEMLEAGGTVMVTAWQEAITAAGLIDTGSMINNVRAGNLKKTEDGGEIVIYPRGNDAKGVSNAQKAFIHHYGSSKNPATGFVDKAEKDGTGKAEAAMAAIWNANG